MTTSQQRQPAITGEQAAILAILLLGFALRLYRLGAESLWLDELGQASVASLGLRAAVEGAQLHHGAAPLDYVFTWLALLVAHDDFLVRLPAVFFGTLTLALVYRLGKELFDGTVGVMAAFLLAVAPLHLRYSQEARFYALFTCLAVASTWVLLLALRRNDRRSWAVYTVLLIASLYSHYYTVLVVLAHGVAVLATRGWPRAFPLPGSAVAAADGSSAAPATVKAWPRGIAPFLLACLVTALAFLPWLFQAVLRETGTPQAELPALTAQQLGQIYAGLVLGPDATEQAVFPVVLLAVLAALGAIVGLVQAPTRLGALLCATLVLVSPPLIILILRQEAYFFAIRQVVFLLPFYLLLAALGMAASLRWLAATAGRGLGQRAARALALAAGAILVLALAWQWQPAVRAVYHTPHQNFRDALAFIDHNAGPTDALVAPRQHPSFFAYYVPGWLGRVHTPVTGKELQAIGQDNAVLWLLASRTPLMTPAMQDWLRQHDVVRLDFGPDVSVYYVRPGHRLAQLLPDTLAWQLPADSHALAGLASYYQQAGMVGQADQLIRQALDHAHDRQEASYYALWRGNLWLDQGNDQQAMAGYRQALDLWPDNVEALRRLGGRLIAQAQPDEAVPVLQRAVTLDPASEWAYWLLANALWEAGRLEEAAAGFQAAIDLNPDNPEPYFRLGGVLQAAGDQAGATNSYRRYLELAPEGQRAPDARSRLESLQ